MAKFEVGDKVRFKKNFTPPGRKTNEQYCKDWGYDPEGVYEVISIDTSIEEKGVWFRCKNIGHNQSDRFEKVEEEKKVGEFKVGDLVRLKEGVTEKDFGGYWIEMGLRDSEEVFSRKPQKIADIRPSSMAFRPWWDVSGYFYKKEWFEKVEAPKEPIQVGDWVKIKPGITDEQYRQKWLLWEEYSEIEAVKEGKVVRVSKVMGDTMKLDSVWTWQMEWFDKAEEPKVTQPESSVKPSPFHTIKNCYNCSHFIPTTNGEGHCDGTLIEKEVLISQSAAKQRCGKSWREKKPVGVGKNLFEGASATKETIHLTPPAPKNFSTLHHQTLQFETKDCVTVEVDRENRFVVAHTVHRGQLYRGVAKCSPQDEWNEEKGKLLAGTRLMQKLIAVREKEISGETK